MVDKLIITEETPSDAIERDISNTMSEISGTLNEIMERFSVNHFKEEAKDRIKEKARRVLSSVRTMSLAAQQRVMNAKNRGQQIIHDNPVAVSMAALGVGAVILMLVLKRRKTTKMTRVYGLRLTKRPEQQRSFSKMKQLRETGMPEEEFKKAA